MFTNFLEFIILSFYTILCYYIAGYRPAITVFIGTLNQTNESFFFMATESGFMCGRCRGIGNSQIEKTGWGAYVCSGSPSGNVAKPGFGE